MGKERKRVGPLITPQDCRRELARVYREVRREELDAQVASRLANILNILISMIRDTDMEIRLRLLEEQEDGKR